MEASYDVITMVHSRIDCDQSSEDEKETESTQIPALRKIKSFFSGRRVKKSKSRVLPEIPSAYWEVGADDFRTAMSLNPMISRTASLHDINASNQRTGDTFKSTDNLLEVIDVAPKREKMQFACVNRKKQAKKTSLNLQPLQVQKGEFFVVNILVLGNSQVGKSSIVRRFVHGTFLPDKLDDANVARCNYQVKIVKLENLDYILHIYEIGEQIPDTVFNSKIQLMGAIIVFDVNDPCSFASVKRWKNMLDLESKERGQFMFPCVMFANKCDSASTSIDRSELKEYCDNRGIAEWFDTSAKNNVNLSNAFIFLLQNIIETHRVSTQQKEDILTML